MTRRIAWIPLLGLAGCCGMFASVPDDQVLCDLAQEEWAEELRDVVQLRPPEFTCEDLLTDARAGEGRVVVVASQLLPGDRGGRARLEQEREYALRRFDQGWRAEDPGDPAVRNRTEVPVGVALDPEVDPVGIASGGIELPPAAAALLVPGAWFAGPWPDLEPGEHLEGAELRAWEKVLEDQVCMADPAPSGAVNSEQPKGSEVEVRKAEMDRQIAESAGILGQLNRYGIAETPEPPHWLDPPDARSLFQRGGAAYVEITPDQIRVNGWPTVSLVDGLPEADRLRGFMITPLYDRLQEMADDAKFVAGMMGRIPSCSFHGRILIGADRRVPAGTLTAVIYTAGQAQFGDPYLLVNDPEPTPVAEVLDRDAPGGGPLHVNVTGATYRLGDEGEPLDSTELLAAVAAEEPTGGSVNVGSGSTVGDVVAGVDALHAQGSSCVMLARWDSDPLTADQVPTLPAERTPAVLPEVVSVLPIQLPTIGPGKDPCSMFFASPATLSSIDDLGSIFGTEGIGVGASSFVGGIIGSQYGNQYGSGGLGSRGSGLGGGGTAEGLGGLGTKGHGRGASGYGSGGGYFGRKSSGTPGMSTGDPIILGALDRSVIDNVIKQHLAQIRYCYQKELNKDPELSGKIVIKFTIAADGTVSSAETNSTTMDNEKVESCICGRFLRFTFPEPEGGGIVIVSYPFVFQPG